MFFNIELIIINFMECVRAAYPARTGKSGGSFQRRMLPVVSPSTSASNSPFLKIAMSPGIVCLKLAAAVAKSRLYCVSSK